MKIIANDILAVFENYTAGKCTRDRALEDVSKIINEYADNRPVVGYVKSGTIRKIFQNILNVAKKNEVNTYEYDVKLHQNDFMDIENILSQLN